MQVVVLALFMGVMVYRALGDQGQLPPPLEGWPLPVLFFAPKLAIAGMYALLCTLAGRMLGVPGGGSAMRWTNLAAEVYRWSIVALFFLDLWMGVPTVVQGWVGDVILLDELIVITPALLMLTFGWWAFYPLDRRMREASLMRRMEGGEAVRPIWSRTQFIVSQVRHQLLLLLVPMVFMLAWFDFVMVSDLVDRWVPADAQPLLMVAGAGVVFLFTPLVMRYVWDTKPLPDGDLRRRLIAMCNQHRVAVRELLLWRTFGGMVNGAVMGVFGGLRYILLTDALLESLPQRQVEAVMAHELAHVRRHHMFWLLLVAGTTMAAATGLIHTAVVQTMDAGILPMWLERPLSSPGAVDVSAMLPAMVVWLLMFGWVSRRFERQADTFAVQHLTRASFMTPDGAAINDNTTTPTEPTAQKDEPSPQADKTIPVTLKVEPEAANAMIRALQQVAVLNNIAVRRCSWRHGSIAWRQTYLRQIVGQPLNDLSIDTQVMWIKTVTALVAIGMVVGGFVYTNASM